MRVTLFILLITASIGFSIPKAICPAGFTTTVSKYCSYTVEYSFRYPDPLAECLTRLAQCVGSFSCNGSKTTSAITQSLETVPPDPDFPEGIKSATCGQTVYCCEQITY